MEHNEDVYDFLRVALKQNDPDIIPVRGPSHFALKDWKYNFGVIGGIEHFTGRETIFFKNRMVYDCNIHGGFVE